MSCNHGKTCLSMRGLRVKGLFELFWRVSLLLLHGLPPGENGSLT